jgi:phospholipid/cholesterol/gamma-HCH transport system permease protein
MADTLAVRGARFVRRRLFDGVAEVGRITMLVGETLRHLRRGVGSFGLVVDQMARIGVDSLGLVFVVSVFTGGVAAVQAAYQFSNVVPLKYIGAVIVRSVIIELGPVLTALVVGGRVGASIAAEIGTMKVTEQIDALSAMAIHPVRYLVVPRVVACLVMLPVLVVFANTVAVVGGFLVSVATVGLSPAQYINGVRDYFYLRDLLSGLFKAFVFGGIIGWMGCYYGFRTEGGAEGVGLATTRAVVASCVLVLVSDYMLAHFLFRILFAHL